jgi:hypothetical protein
MTSTLFFRALESKISSHFSLSTHCTVTSCTQLDTKTKPKNHGKIKERLLINNATQVLIQNEEIDILGNFD